MSWYDVAVLKSLIDSGADINASIGERYPIRPIHAFLRKFSRELDETLNSKYMLSEEMYNVYENEVYNYSFDDRKVEYIKSLLDLGASIDYSDSKMLEFSLYSIVYTGNMDIVRMFDDIGFDFILNKKYHELDNIFRVMNGCNYTIGRNEYFRSKFLTFIFEEKGAKIDSLDAYCEFIVQSVDFVISHVSEVSRGKETDGYWNNFYSFIFEKIKDNNHYDISGINKFMRYKYVPNKEDDRYEECTTFADYFTDRLNVDYLENKKTSDIIVDFLSSVYGGDFSKAFNDINKHKKVESLDYLLEKVYINWVQKANTRNSLKI